MTTPTASQTPARCLVSERFRFIGLLIAKNATSTLRGELGRASYGAKEWSYVEVDPHARRTYFTFAFLRDPVARLLSAYQEISMRFESDPQSVPRRAFLAMDDTPERFAAFLDVVGDGRWDRHLRFQADYVAGARVDCFATLERFQLDLEAIYRRLALGRCPTMPYRRSRRRRREVHGYDKFLLDETDLDVETRQRVRRLLAVDLELYARAIVDRSPSLPDGR